MKTETVIGLTGGIVSSILAAATGCWQNILVIFIVYGICLLGNLSSGLLYARQTATYSREKGRHATYQKLGMIVGIGVSAAVDIVLVGIAAQNGVPYNVTFLTFLLAGYATVHEFSSMLTNLKKLGNHVPGKLEDVVKGAEEALNKGEVPKFPNTLDRGEPE